VVDVAQERARLELAMALRELRDKAGLSQTELAELLGVTQANVSRIENEGDPQLSTIIGYVSAMGADLVLKATFPDGDEEVVLVDVKGFGAVGAEVMHEKFAEFAGERTTVKAASEGSTRRDRSRAGRRSGARRRSRPHAHRTHARRGSRVQVIGVGLPD
jgi:transcriptional regulator with XRE-family HTH domain